MQNSQAAFMNDLAALVEANPTELGPDHPLNDSNWDSVAVISGIALIDKHFGVTVPGDALASCGSVGELLRLIESSGQAGRT
jgi:acyl carrier protein